MVTMIKNLKSCNKIFYIILLELIQIFESNTTMSEEEERLFVGLSESDSDGDGSKFLTDDAYFSQVINGAENAAKILNIHPDVALMCLQMCRWDENQLLLEYPQDKEAFLQKIGLSEVQSHQPQGTHQNPVKGRQECTVCYTNVVGKNLLALPCNHYFCKKCWENHINASLQNAKTLITCMEPGCKCPLMLTDIRQICGASTALELQKRLAASSVQASTVLKRCINPKCELSLGVENISYCNIATCKCGTRMCWLCGREAHAPLPCIHVDKWQEIAKDNISDFRIRETTKPCPKCRVRIEKNGGCNHMTCKTCGYEFCWRCGVEWSTHTGDPYECNSTAFTSTSLDEKLTPEENVLKLFLENVQAEEAEKFMYDAIKKKIMAALFQKRKKVHTSIEEEENEANSILSSELIARSVLKWSYPSLTYINETKRKIYEFWMADITKYLSMLNYNLEILVVLNIKNILHIQSMLDASVESLLKHADGL